MPPLLGGPVQLRAKVFSAATKASVTITRDRSGSLRRRANRTDRGGEPLARGDLAQGPGGGSATASPWPHSHDVCGRYRAASPPGKPARQLGYGVSRANGLALQARHERWAARWTPKALVAIRRPIIAAIWNMLTSGQPGHVVGATTARAAARKPQAESSRKSQKSRRADPAGSLGEHRPTRRYWGHLTELADPSHARVRQPDPLTAAAPDEPSGAPLRPALRAASLTCQLLTSSIGPSLSDRPYRLTSGTSSIGPSLSERPYRLTSGPEA